ncbi:MAG: cation:dicarboxylase symporter family transporter [Anaerolineaceae bacterium]|nr:cation:dicarboxylase symporter family transporter [Anaerolineaceae bacterium]
MKATLSNENINLACEQAGDYMTQKKAESREVLRTKFNLEEVLLKYQEKFGEETVFKMDCFSWPTRIMVFLTIHGPSFDPFAETEFVSEEDQMMHNALVRMGNVPSWSYRFGNNTVVFVQKKRQASDLFRILAAIIAAVICGFILRSLPDNIRITASDGIISPLMNTYIGFLNAVASPMIFLSILWSICSIGDTATFSILGKKLMIKFMLYLVIVTAIAGLLSMPFFSLNRGVTDELAGSRNFSVLYLMTLDIIPNNLFTPFTNGNTLQVLFLGILFGVFMLVFRESTGAVTVLVEQLNTIVNGIMTFLSSLIPFFIFGSLCTIIAASEFSALAIGAKFFFISLAGCVFNALLHTAVTCIRTHMTPLALWKKVFSTFIISITTASSVAGFQDNINTCINKLGISKKLTYFGLPFGIVMYKPGVSLLFLFGAICMAEKYGITISTAWIITAVLICVVLSTATPPIPGGIAASFSILFSQLGLPTNELAVILSLTTILDFVVTAVGMFVIQCVLLITSTQVDLSNDEKEVQNG